MKTVTPGNRGLIRIFAESLAHRIGHLPISFYLILAIILVLLLGVKGFKDLSDPKQLAFSLTVFVVFFGVVTYRALMDAIDIARRYRREQTHLLASVLERDQLSKTLGRKVAETESTPDGPES